MLTVFLHGPDRINNDDEWRGLFFSRVIENVRWLERNVTKHQRSVVFGDFNANPFEPAVVGSRGLHSISVKHVGRRHSRMVMGQAQDFFFNPMWSLLGHRSGKPPGSYYFNESRIVEYFWHMLDQVVLRPAMVPHFPENELKVLDRAGPIRLISDLGLPARNVSDHLPVIFTLRKRSRSDANGR